LLQAPRNGYPSIEDFKDDHIYSGSGIEHESFAVPEEIEEELPLRVRTLEYEAALAGSHY
jgi:hypothetical protein